MKDSKIIIDYCLPDNEEDAIELIRRGLENIKNDDLAKEKIAEVILDDDPDRIGIDVSEAVHVVWIKKEDFLEIAERIKKESDKNERKDITDDEKPTFTIPRKRKELNTVRIIRKDDEQDEKVEKSLAEIQEEVIKIKEKLDNDPEFRRRVLELGEQYRKEHATLSPEDLNKLIGGGDKK